MLLNKLLRSEKHLISFFIKNYYIFYVLGIIYIVPIFFSWFIALKTLLTPSNKSFPAIWYIWLIMAILMYLSLIMGHINFNLGFAMLLKSSIGWMKGWALLPLFIGFGSIMLISPARVARCVCQLLAFTAVLIPILLILAMIGIPGKIYTSPLYKVFGVSAEFFTIALYSITPSEGVRFPLFAPWAPAIGFFAVIAFWIIRLEVNSKLRYASYIAVLAMVALSASRLAWIALLGSSFLIFLLENKNNGFFYIVLSIITVFIGLNLDTMLVILGEIIQGFHSLRSNSSFVRATLGDIAVYRWKTEAFWFGHGNVEFGPHLVEFMPIGSHHTWLGLLFIKGIVGFFALAFALITTTIMQIYYYNFNKLSQSGLGITITIILFTFGENLEILTYLIWPGLIVIGQSLSYKGNNYGR